MKKIDHATFGPGGNSDAFKLAGKKSTIEAPEWIKSIGLDAYEYEAGRGVNAGSAALKAIGDEAKKLIRPLAKGLLTDDRSDWVYQFMESAEPLFAKQALDANGEQCRSAPTAPPGVSPEGEFFCWGGKYV